MIRRPPGSTRTDTLFPYTTRFRSQGRGGRHDPFPGLARDCGADLSQLLSIAVQHPIGIDAAATADRRLSARQQDGLWLFEIQPAVQPAADPRPYVDRKSVV